MVFSAEQKRAYNLQRSIDKGRKIYKTEKRAKDEVNKNQEILQETLPVTLEEAMRDNERKAMLLSDAEGLRDPIYQYKAKKFRAGDIVTIKPQFRHLFLDHSHPSWTFRCQDFATSKGWYLIFADGPYKGKVISRAPEACLERV